MTLANVPLEVIERRIFRTEFREVPGSNGRQRWARAVTYGTVDDYGTTWLPRCFYDALEQRMPTILYGHDWYTLDHVLGQGVDHREVLTADDYGPPGCDVLMEFADPEQVPSARLALVLTSRGADGRSAILKDCSVGFDRQEWIRKEDLSPDQLAMGAEEAMVRAAMDELSIVVRGAVPGASLRGKRAWVIDGKVSDTPPPEQSAEQEATVALSTYARVLAAKREGKLSDDDARDALVLLLDAQDETERTMTDETRQPADADEDVPSLALAIDAALDAALACAVGVDVTTWPAECQQMWASVVAAETAVDELLDTLGVADPDDQDTGEDTTATMVGSMMGTASADDGETRAAPGEDEIVAALAKVNRRR